MNEVLIVSDNSIANNATETVLGNVHLEIVHLGIVIIGMLIGIKLKCIKRLMQSEAFDCASI